MSQRISSSISLLSISIMVGCGISGTVVDEEGAGIEGVEVMISGVKSDTTTTNSSGKYAFSVGIFAGDYAVSVDLSSHQPGCILEEQNVTVPVGRSVSVDFSLLDCLPGACCTEVQCVDDTSRTICEGVAGGAFMGGNTECSAVNCDIEPIGACCVEGSCTDNTPQWICEKILSCENTSDGIFMGNGSVCNGPGAVSCP